MEDLEQFITQFGGLTEQYFFYNNEVELRYDPKEHEYLLVTGDGLEPLWGVTTVVHIVDKSEALVPWACKMMQQKLMATAPIITLPDNSQILGHLSLEKFSNLVTESKSAHKERLEEAGNIGHIAHAWIEQYIKLRLVSDSDERAILHHLGHLPDNEKAASCCRAALDWMYKHNVLWISTERKIYSRKYKYAGTMDGLCWVDSCDNPTCCPKPFKDRLTVADWKSSNYLYPEYLLQTAAYMQAHNEERLYENPKAQMATDRWVIRLGKEDGEFDPWHLGAEDFTQDFNAFIECLDLNRSMTKIRQRMKDRDQFIRGVKKEAAKLAREEALKLACVNAKKYQGIRAPKCNGGNPCQSCLKKHEEFQALKRSAKESAKQAKAAARMQAKAAARAEKEKAKAAAKAAKAQARAAAKAEKVKQKALQNIASKTISIEPISIGEVYKIINRSADQS